MAIFIKPVVWTVTLGAGAKASIAPPVGADIETSAVSIQNSSSSDLLISGDPALGSDAYTLLPGNEFVVSDIAHRYTNASREQGDSFIDLDETYIESIGGGTITLTAMIYSKSRC